MNVLIVGATSGIGKSLIKEYTSKSNLVIAIGRRKEILDKLSSTYSDKIITQGLDINDTETTIKIIESIWQKVKSIDLVIICAGTGELNHDLDFNLEYKSILTNVVGWTNVVDYVYSKFLNQGFGHLATITSVGGLRGEPNAPAYSATKAYQINYTEALRKKAKKSNLPIFVSDIRPGLVDTRMAKGEGLFWVMPVEKIACQIVKALGRRRSLTVVSRRWNIIHFIMKVIPNWLYDKL